MKNSNKNAPFNIAGQGYNLVGLRSARPARKSFAEKVKSELFTTLAMIGGGAILMSLIVATSDVTIATAVANIKLLTSMITK